MSVAKRARIVGPTEAKLSFFGCIHVVVDFCYRNEQLALLRTCRALETQISTMALGLNTGPFAAYWCPNWHRKLVLRWSSVRGLSFSRYDIWTQFKRTEWCRKLERVDFAAYCEFIDTAFLDEIAEACPKLAHLTFVWTEGISVAHDWTRFEHLERLRVDRSAADVCFSSFPQRLRLLRVEVNRVRLLTVLPPTLTEMHAKVKHDFAFDDFGWTPSLTKLVLAFGPGACIPKKTDRTVIPKLTEIRLWWPSEAWLAFFAETFGATIDTLLLGLEGPVDLSAFPALTRLEINVAPLRFDALALRLRHLTLSSTQGLKRMPRECPELRHLTVDNEVGDQEQCDFSALSTMPRLETFAWDGPLGCVANVDDFLNPNLKRLEISEDDTVHKRPSRAKLQSFLTQVSPTAHLDTPWFTSQD